MSTLQSKKLSSADDVLRTIMRLARRPHFAYWLDRHRLHPNYPGFSSLDYIFRHLEMDTLSIQAGYDELPNLPFPLVAYLNMEGGMFACITGADAEKVQVQVRGRDLYLTREVFEQIWNGAVMLIDFDPVPESGRPVPDSSGQRNRWMFHTLLRYRFCLPAFSIVCLWGWLIWPLPELSFFNGLFLSLSCLGLAVCLLLSGYRGGREGTAGRLCHIVRNKRVDCASVLSSRYAAIGGLLPWSAVGVVYFIWAVLLLLSFRAEISVPAVAAASLLSLPATVYLIFLQWSRIRRFCLFCLFVQSVLSGSACAAGYYFLQAPPMTVSVKDLSGCGILLGAIAACYWIVVRAISDSRQRMELAGYNNRLRFRPDVMSEYFRNSGKVDREGAEWMTLCPGGSHELLLVADPLCGGCMQVLGLLLEQLPYYRNTTFHLLLFAGSEQSRRKVQRLWQCYETLSPEDFFRILSTYARTGKCPEIAGTAKTDAIDKNRLWCEKNGIDLVPRLYYNGRSWPEAYSWDDVNYVCR